MHNSAPKVFLQKKLSTEGGKVVLVLNPAFLHGKSFFRPNGFIKWPFSYPIYRQPDAI